MEEKHKLIGAKEKILCLIGALVVISLSLIFIILGNQKYKDATDDLYLINSEQVYEDTENNLVINNEEFTRIELLETLEDNSYFYNDLVNLSLFLETSDSDLYFSKQGFYINMDKEQKLLFYITEDAFYINNELFKTLKAKDLTKYCRTLKCSLEDTNLNYFTEDVIHQLFIDIGEKSSHEISVIFLPLIFDSIKGKPIIYLYSDKEMDVHIDLELKSDILDITYPEYKNGWDVRVIPNKGIQDKNGRLYDYLYWESKSNDVFDLSEGFIIDKENYINFLQIKLVEVGLSDKEVNEFITYWLPYISQYPYVLMKFEMEGYEESVKLNITPTPDNILRVFVVFKGLDKPIDIEEQDLSYYEDFERTGFTVVEWGGTFIE